MVWYEKLKDIDLRRVKEVAAELGKNSLIAKELDIPYYRLIEIRYRSYLIASPEYRSLVIKIAKAIEDGVCQYRLNKLDDYDIDI